ncbi:hypothetical protein GW796_09005 [archaeon]|nr:hypothetical protein [archaeon]NCT58870.1 hypothetical protein [archaeon]
MAYVSQDEKRKLSPIIKEVLKKHGLKGSISINNYTTLVVTIKSGTIDFKADAIHKEYWYNVNEYFIEKHYTGKAQKALLELRDAMNIGNYNNTHANLDVGWYIEINLGTLNKSYILEK